ncbi:MAG: CehA/McbA family metallohydrolase, partial [Dehalococcoidia bacterium]|nr:CehA/McbA family metallohydrolase [Dehalococcoidia bacterium]
MSEQTWYRGNIHTHTTESDGDAEPAKAAAWYREHGYDFLVLSDHNHLTLLDYGNGRNGSPGPLMIPGEEVTLPVRGASEGVPVHLGAIGIDRIVEPIDTGDVASTLQANIDAIREAGGISCINHPSWKWAFDHEQILKTRGASMLEVFNAASECNNFPIPVPGFLSPSQIWDNVLSAGVPIFGVASDDSHDYHDFSPEKENPGRGWVMVESDGLESEAVVEAMAAGRFYSSTGVFLSYLEESADEVSLKIRRKADSIFLTRFIGVGGTVYDEQVGREVSYCPT